MNQASADLLMEDIGRGNRLFEDSTAKTKACNRHGVIEKCNCNVL